MCSTCTGSPSCGWSDHVSVTCTVSNREVDPGMLQLGAQRWFLLTKSKDVYARGPCSYDSSVEIGKCAGEFTEEMRNIFEAHH